MRYKLIVLFLLFFISNKASADVFINEVAWMGTSISASNEWIELYNNGANSVDLSGWVLKTGDASISINLSGSISSGGFYLIERTDDTTVPSVISNLVASFGHGLSNNGENLILKDTGGSEVDTLPFVAGWPAGDNITKQTMQKVGSSWNSASPTPKASNVGVSANIQGASSSGNTNIISTSEQTVSASTSSLKNKINEIPKILTDIIVKDTVLAGIPIKINSKTIGLNKETLTNGKFVWNFGDGMYLESKDSKPFEYTYEYPGEYVLSLEYYQHYYSQTPDATDRITVKVIPANVIISSVGNGLDPFVEIENKSNSEVDLSNWGIKSLNKYFHISHNTVILPGKKIKFSPKVTGFVLEDLVNLSLQSPLGVNVNNAILSTENKISKKEINTQNLTQSPRGSKSLYNTFPEVNTNEVVNLNDLTANAVDSEAKDSNYLKNSYIGLIGVIALGAISTFFVYFKNKKSKDELESSINADDISIIE